MYGNSENVSRSIEDAADCGGKFLDGLGKTDLMNLTRDEWMAFVCIICTEYDDSYDRRIEAQRLAERLDVKEWNIPSAISSVANYFDDEIPF